MNNIGYYLINVDDRPDRLENCKQRFQQIGLDFERVSAITGNSLVGNTYLFTKPNTEANWRSILKSLDLFRKSENDLAIIFEDDVFFKNGFASLVSNLHAMESINFDVLQIGFLTFKGRNDDKGRTYIKIIKRNCLDKMVGFKWFSVIFKNFALQYRVDSKLEKREFIRKSLGLDTSLEPQFEPGTHCFVVSRDFAEVISKFNLPMLMSADLVFMTLSKMKVLNIFRLGKSLAGQDDTLPSIGGHATQEYDLTNLIIK